MRGTSSSVSLQQFSNSRNRCANVDFPKKIREENKRRKT